MAEAKALKATCQQLSQTDLPIILDLSRITLDSSVIDALVSSLKTAAELGVELVLGCASPSNGGFARRGT